MSEVGDSIRGRLTYANVMATIAMFGVVAGGGAYAASKIGSNQIQRDAVLSRHIAAGNVRSPDLGREAVTAAKIAKGGAFHEIGAQGEPPFENSWGNWADSPSIDWSDAGFYRDPLGIVHLKGTLQGGPNGSIAFVLPPGFRPAQRLFLPAASGGEFDASAVIGAEGQVWLTVGAGGTPPFVGIDGLTFRAGA